MKHFHKEDKFDNYILKSTYEYKIEHLSNELNKKIKQIQEIQGQKAAQQNEIIQLSKQLNEEKKVNNQLLQLISNGMNKQPDDCTQESRNKLIETNFNLTNSLQSVQAKLKDAEQKIEDLKKKQKICKYASQIQCKFCYELLTPDEFLDHIYDCQGKHRKVFMCSEVFLENKPQGTSFNIENEQYKVRLDKINYQHFPYHNTLEIYCEFEITSKFSSESWKLTKSLQQLEQLTKQLNNNQILQFYLSSPNNFQKNKIALESIFIKNEHFVIQYFDQLLTLAMNTKMPTINNFFQISPQLLLSYKRSSQPAANLLHQFQRLETTPDFCDIPIIEETSRLFTPRDQNSSISFRPTSSQNKNKQNQFKKVYQINYEKILEKRKSLNSSSQKQKNQLAKLIPQTERNYKMSNQNSKYRSIPKKESTNVTLSSNNYNPESSFNSNYSSCKFNGLLLKTKVQNPNYKQSKY